MITSSMVYWVTRLDQINFFLVTSSIVLIIYVVVGLYVGGMIIYNTDDKSLGKKIFRTIPVCLVLSILFLLINTFVPTTKEACAILIIPKIASSEQVQEMPNKIVELANDWIEELKPTKMAGE